MKKTLALLCLSFSCMACTSQPQTKLDTNAYSMFPAAKAGQVRWIINLPSEKDEDIFKIELVPGIVMDVDCNKFFLSGELEEKILEGWGYTYYVFNTNGTVGSTRMACGDAAWHKDFVRAQSMLIRYNSKMPIVIYAPENYTIKYAVWKRENLLQASVHN